MPVVVVEVVVAAAAVVVVVVAVVVVVVVVYWSAVMEVVMPVVVVEVVVVAAAAVEVVVVAVVVVVVVVVIVVVYWLWRCGYQKRVQHPLFPATTDRLVGQVVRHLPREWKIPGSNPACAGIFSGSSHSSDSNIGTSDATLPGAWRYRVSAGTGRPGVSIL